jgi:predicted extracellular nuclease
LNSVALRQRWGQRVAQPALARRRSGRRQWRVDVNHLSKGSARRPRYRRRPGQLPPCANAANALTAWLASDPTGTGTAEILLLGATTLCDGRRSRPSERRFANLGARSSAAGYTYVFDGPWGHLDYALGSAARPKVTGVGYYHINADGPSSITT